MCTHGFVRIIRGIVIPIIIPMVCSHYIYVGNVHPYFSLKNLGKKVHVIHGKIQYYYIANSIVSGRQNKVYGAECLTHTGSPKKVALPCECSDEEEIEGIVAA